VSFFRFRYTIFSWIPVSCLVVCILSYLASIFVFRDLQNCKREQRNRARIIATICQFAGCCLAKTFLMNTLAFAWTSSIEAVLSIWTNNEFDFDDEDG